MNKIFQTVNPVRESYLQRLFKQKPEENAVIELNNLLASHPVKEISQNDISLIESKYTLNLRREFSLNLEEFYATYLNACLAGQSLTSEALSELEHLKSILSLDDQTIGNLHIRIGSVVYEQAFQKAIAGGRFTEGRQDLLDKLAADLRLPQKLTDKISLETRKAYVDKFVLQILGRKQFSPEEESEFKAITDSLKISPDLSKDTLQQLERYKHYWQLKNLPLPELATDMHLQKTENCYFKSEGVRWYELRKVRRKGYSDDELTLIDQGPLFLTDKRIIFNGSKKTSTIQLSKILKIIEQKDSLRLEKDTGKDVTFRLPDRTDIFHVILDRLLEDK